jgi:hypothetical protein
VPSCHGRLEVRDHHEVAVAALPGRHVVAVDGVHVHVDGEQVVASLGVVLHDFVEEMPRRQSLPLETPLHVCDTQQHGVDRPVSHGTAELVERHFPLAVRFA